MSLYAPIPASWHVANTQRPTACQCGCAAHYPHHFGLGSL